MHSASSKFHSYYFLRSARYVTHYAIASLTKYNMISNHDVVFKTNYYLVLFTKHITQVPLESTTNT